MAVTLQKIAVVLMSLAVMAGCKRDESARRGSGQSVGGGHVNYSEYAKLRAQAVGQYAGAPVTPVASSDDLVGSWEMRFGGPVGSDEIQWIYEFKRDGTVIVGEEVWRWRFDNDGTVIFVVTVPPDPKIPGLEQGATSEELHYVFKTQDGRIVLSNEDTSVIELLTKATGRTGGTRPPGR